MGISAIFKRPKATSSSSQVSTDDSIKDGQRPRHIKRRPTASGNRSSEDHMNPKAPAPKVSKGAARIISRTSSTSDIGELPTPKSSLNEGPGASRTRSSATKSMAAPIALPARSQADSDMFGLYRLTTPPLDSATPQLREIDPFEDSPPPRPLTDFEDPVYIPPLTLAATLVDDYGTMGGVAQVGSNNATNAATLATTSVRATASTFARSSTTTAAGSLDLLSEFNASYNYLFGTLPSDSALAANSFDSGANNSLEQPSAKSSAAVTATPSRPNAKLSRTADTGMQSPVSVKTVGSGGSSDNVPDESANEDDALSQASSSPSEDIELTRELEEERRKEEERKAAEQRNRRRELIKQQVAFERMKERHRRQYPGQQQPVSAHNSVARWQKESANAVAPPQQQAMYASNGAINRGYAQAMPPHQPHVAPHGNNNVSASYANLPTSASMSNIAYMADSQNAGIASAQFATLPRHKNQGFPLIADTFAARPGQTAQQQHSASFSGYIPVNGHQMQQQQALQPLQLQPPVPSAHPVKLASMPQRAKNPYLSDSSDDDGGSSSASDEVDSDDMTSIGSSDISCDPPLEQREPDTVPLGINGGGIRAPRSVSQPIMTVGGSDTSSDTSAKSQSSSTRRVRFHETVSVVFNTRHTVAGEDFEEPDALESDNDSSNASIDMNVTSTSGANSGLCLAGGSSDEAFDGSNAYSHSRYQIPPTFIPTQSDSTAQWYDEESTTVANSKDTSGYSSRNISPDGTKRQSQRPKHRIETQPLRDREAERELRKKAQGGRHASQPPIQRPRPTPPPKQVQAAAPASSDPQTPPVTTPAPAPPVTELASDSQKPPVDHMAEARRALLGHYNVPNPELPIGRSIPRSGTATTTSFTRTSSVKILQPPSFARPKQRPAASNPQLNIRSVSEHKPTTMTYTTQPQRQSTATAKESSSTDVNYALRNSSIATFDASTKAKPIEDDNSDGDDVPLSAFARSRSEPMSSLPRRSTDDYLSRHVTASNNYDSDSNAMAVENSAAKSTNARRFFGRNQADVAGNPISRSNTLSSVSVPKVGDHVATFEQMRSLSMDVAPRQSTEKRRFGRWGNFF
ncbi:hypothetical protein GGI01_003153 [Coemansia sp. RSA 376]|nr:hypothetical protein GGI01_003153 [Coemansia sp. RSA 376]